MKNSRIRVDEERVVEAEAAAVVVAVAALVPVLAE